MIGSEICYDAGRNDKKHRVRLSEFTPMACLQREYRWTREISYVGYDNHNDNL